MKASMRLEVAQGSDTVEQVMESLLDGLNPDRVIVTPTDMECETAGNKVWRFAGDVRDLFTVLLNYVGIRGGDRVLLNALAHNITAYETVSTPV